MLEHLPRETREYVPKMIAVTLLANDADALGFDMSGVEAYRYAICHHRFEIRGPQPASGQP